MDRSGDELLAGPRLTSYQDARISLRDPREVTKEPLHPAVSRHHSEALDGGVWRLTLFSALVDEKERAAGGVVRQAEGQGADEEDARASTRRHDRHLGADATALRQRLRDGTLSALTA